MAAIKSAAARLRQGVLGPSNDGECWISVPLPPPPAFAALRRGKAFARRVPRRSASAREGGPVRNCFGTHG